MKKELPVMPFLFPQPVLVIGTYNDDDTPNAMTMAWGGICDVDKVALNLTETHHSVSNIKKRKAFTLAIADAAHVKAADFVGLVSADQDADKMKKSGLHDVKSAAVDAPYFEEFPFTLCCTVLAEEQGVGGYRVVGKIESVLADESVLDADGKVDAKKLSAVMFDGSHNSYFGVGEKVADAFSVGKQLL